MQVISFFAWRSTFTVFDPSITTRAETGCGSFPVERIFAVIDVGFFSAQRTSRMERSKTSSALSAAPMALIRTLRFVAQFRM